MTQNKPWPVTSTEDEPSKSIIPEGRSHKLRGRNISPAGITIPYLFICCFSFGWGTVCGLACTLTRGSCSSKCEASTLVECSYNNLGPFWMLCRWDKLVEMYRGEQKGDYGGVGLSVVGLEWTFPCGALRQVRFKVCPRNMNYRIITRRFYKILKWMQT